MEATMDLASAIKRWQTNWRRADEFGSLDQDQREALARDIGVSPEMLGLLVERGPEAAQELPRLMSALALDADRTRHIHAAVMRDMSVTCSGCMAAVQCQHDLDQGRSSARYAEYCPNAETLRELRGEVASRSVHD
jgi:hypothetical protein